MKVAVTGPTGEIGSELLRIILDKGHEAIAIIRPGSERRKNLPASERLKVVECDISDYKSLASTDTCDLFIHMAWENPFGAERDNAAIQTKNIEYSLDAVNLAKSWKATAFVGTGSQAEYGVTEQTLDRHTVVDPASGYGIAKYAAGKMCGLLCKQLRIKYNWGRIVSVFGKYDKDQTLIMYLVKTLLSGGTPQLTKCEQVWDYSYSKDIARALLLIGTKGVDGKTYCIGNGSQRTLREYVTAARDIINPNAELNFGAKEYYPHQPMRLCVDISELTADTGYVPEYSFEDGIKEMVGFLTSRK